MHSILNRSSLTFTPFAAPFARPTELISRAPPGMSSNSGFSSMNRSSAAEASPVVSSIIAVAPPMASSLSCNFFRVATSRSRAFSIASHNQAETSRSCVMRAPVSQSSFTPKRKSTDTSYTLAALVMSHSGTLLVSVAPSTLDSFELLL